MLLGHTPDFTFAPDDLTGGAAGAATQTPPAAPASTTPAPSTPAPSTPATGANGTSGVGGAPTTPSAPSWLDTFKADGYNGPADETQARQTLLQSYRDAERLRPIAPALSAYQQHAQEFHKWLADRQKPAQSSQESWTRKAGWNHPEWNPAWKHQVTTDANGNVVPVPGVPADVALKYQQAQAFRQDFVEKLLTDPGEALKPFIDARAIEISRQQAQENVTSYRDKQEADQFIQQNSDWLYNQQTGPDGKTQLVMVINPQTGQYEPQISQWGTKFKQAMLEGQQRGLQTMQDQKDYALQKVRMEYFQSPDYANYVYEQKQKQLAAQQQPAGGGQQLPPAVQSPRQQANQGWLQKTNPAAQPTALPNAGNATPTPDKVTRENLFETMLKRITENGGVQFGNQ